MSDSTNEVKRGRGRPKLSEEEKKERAELRIKNGLLPARVNEHTTPGDNSKYLRHALATMGMPPIQISDPKQVEERIWWYFSHCADNDMKPTVSGMCNSLGIHRDTIHSWRVGDRRAGGEHQEIILRAYKVLEELWEDYMMNGKINPVSGIFLGKNLFSYSDQKELVLTPNQQQEVLDPETIAQKYAELPDVEADEA